MASKQAIEELLKSSPYAASNQAQLEAYVDAQAKGDAPYYMDANRSLLKLYQFFPQSANESKISTILFLAMLEFPSTDFLAMSYLVPERVQKADSCAGIVKCAGLLDSCKFEEFWTAFAEINGESKVAGATKKLQAAIAQSIALSHRTAKLAMVLSSTKMASGDELSKAGISCIESVSGDIVTFVASTDNTKRNRVFQEGVNFSALASMMAKVTAE
jgi:hypothetical protein